jgi:outer membrane protein assembly factor BamB
MSTTEHDDRPETPDGPQPPPEPSSRGLSRRQFLPAAGGTLGLAVAGLIGYEIHPSGSGSTTTETETSTSASTSSSTTATEVPSAELQSFVTRPDLRPPAIKVDHVATNPADDTAVPYILLTANNVIQGGPVQQGLMIVDRQGRLIYFQPIDSKPFDLNAQNDRGTPVLTWWEGHLVASHGAGSGMVMNGKYQPVQKIQAGNGLQIDLHELNLTSHGTALITAYEQTTTNLRSIGGSATGKVFAGHAQEIDLKTGKVLFDFNSLDHIAVSETYAQLPKSASGVLDYLHMNSVSEAPDGNLLISGRNTSALYKVDRSSGEVLWRLNGRKSDFQVASAARFHWQHDARSWSDTQYTVFDNGAKGTEKRSRGLLLDVDESAKTVGLTQAYLHPAAFVSQALGSVTLLPDGHVFVGWGDQPYFSEFAADGTLLLDGQLPINVRSYRALPASWTGTPTAKPAISARTNPAGGFVIRVSWNGATEVARWEVLGGPSVNKMSVVGSQVWGGFETAIVINSLGPSFQVVALDANGRELGRSEIV